MTVVSIDEYTTIYLQGVFVGVDPNLQTVHKIKYRGTLDGWVETNLLPYECKRLYECAHFVRMLSMDTDVVVVIVPGAADTNIFC